MNYYYFYQRCDDEKPAFVHKRLGINHLVIVEAEDVRMANDLFDSLLDCLLPSEASLLSWYRPSDEEEGRRHLENFSIGTSLESNAVVHYSDGNSDEGFSLIES